MYGCDCVVLSYYESAKYLINNNWNRLYAWIWDKLQKPLTTNCSTIQWMNEYLGVHCVHAQRASHNYYHVHFTLLCFIMFHSISASFSSSSSSIFHSVWLQVFVFSQYTIQDWSRCIIITFHEFFYFVRFNMISFSS